MTRSTSSRVAEQGHVGDAGQGDELRTMSFSTMRVSIASLRFGDSTAIRTISSASWSAL
jgi:hypothetical protein